MTIYWFLRLTTLAAALFALFGYQPTTHHNPMRHHSTAVVRVSEAASEGSGDSRTTGHEDNDDGEDDHDGDHDDD